MIVEIKKLCYYYIFIIHYNKKLTVFLTNKKQTVDIKN